MKQFNSNFDKLPRMKKKGWIVIHRDVPGEYYVGSVFKTKEEALNLYSGSLDAAAVIKIEWEE